MAPHQLVFTLIAPVPRAVIAVLYDANFGPNPEKYSSVSQYLIFNDSWVPTAVIAGGLDGSLI